MSPLWAVILFVQQPDPARWVEALGSDRIEERGRAASILKTAGRDFRDAARLWLAAAACADPATALRLIRIRRAWRRALVDVVGIEEIAPEDPDWLWDDLDEEGLEIALKLCTTRLTIRTTNAPLSEILDYLRGLVPVNFFVLGVPDPAKIFVHVEAEDQPLDALLALLLKPRKLCAVIQDGLVLIGPPATVRARIRLRLYNVADLTWGEPGEALVEQIVRDVQPRDWEQNAGRSIQFQNDLLIVRNTAVVHRSLCAYLNRIRTVRPETPAGAPEPSLAKLFLGLWGPHPAQEELRLASIGRDLTILLESLHVELHSPDPDRQWQAREVGVFLRERLNEEPVRQVLESGGP